MHFSEFSIDPWALIVISLSLMGCLAIWLGRGIWVDFHKGGVSLVTQETTKTHRHQEPRPHVEFRAETDAVLSENLNRSGKN